MLDGRYYRTDPKVVDPSMLGPVQKAWLLKMLCSPVPWTFGAKGNSLDTWNGFQAEREEIFGHIEQNRLTGVILISADRHRYDAWRIKRPNGYDLYEFNSSRFTNQYVHKTMPSAIFSYNQKQSFGLVNIDTTCQPPTVTYQVVNIEGEIIKTLVVSLEQLQF